MHPYYKQKNLNKFCQKYEIQLFGYSVLGRPSFDIAMGSNIRMLDDVTLNEIATKNGISSA